MERSGTGLNWRSQARFFSRCVGGKRVSATHRRAWGRGPLCLLTRARSAFRAAGCLLSFGPRGGQGGNSLGNGGFLTLGKGVPPTLARVASFDCPDARNAALTDYWNQAPPRASVAPPRRALTSDRPGRRAGGRRGGGQAKRRRNARGQG
jgi:hypothetical protein